MEKIIIEFIREHGPRREAPCVLMQPVVRIGRGYDNDVILSDPHASVHHCVIRAQDAGFVVEDLATTNGTFLNGKHQIQGPTAIVSGDELTIGRTRLRFLTSTHPLEPALPMGDPGEFFSEINRPAKAWLIVLAALLLCEVVEHQESYKNMAVEKFVSIGIGMVLILLVWAGIWAFIGRIIKHKSSFHAQLSWTALFFLSMTLCYPLSDHIGYNTNSALIEMITGSVIFGIFLALLVAGHLMIATFISRRNQIIASSVISIVILTFGLVTYYASKSDFDPRPNFYSTLLPPYAKWVPSVTVDEFIAKSQDAFLTKNDDTADKR